ncbi:hypothetical protein MJO28_004245 [Puccinia striiformis f. sp. tritici]|uniref:Uncharacterized protein n=1 Tax=Puccinia striiformis f. sp. tritici TaxID=168172 RepID=A0ACC0ENW7_9BASI|nr:hypothetical protein MJO28_004245 [Puccinia striiformis f. sp. tritici]
MISQNDGTAPVITYFPEEVLRIGPATEPPLDLTNKASAVGLGYVEERREVETNGGDGEPHLEVIVSHNDWDSHVCKARSSKHHMCDTECCQLQNQCHKAFKVILLGRGDLALDYDLVLRLTYEV